MTKPIADPVALLRSRSYLVLLAFAAVLGVPISAAAYGFLALVDYLQKEIFVHLPHGFGYPSAPTWWPLPVLLVGGITVALAIKYLPGDGGPSPAHGFKSMFIGAAIGLAVSRLPGLDPVAGAAMGIGAMSAVMLTLPLTSVLLATLLLSSDGLTEMPLVIVAVVVSYVVAAHVAPKPATERQPSPERQS